MTLFRDSPALIHRYRLRFVKIVISSEPCTTSGVKRLIGSKRGVVPFGA